MLLLFIMICILYIYIYIWPCYCCCYYSYYHSYWYYYILIIYIYILIYVIYIIYIYPTARELSPASAAIFKQASIWSSSLAWPACGRRIRIETFESIWVTLGVSNDGKQYGKTICDGQKNPEKPWQNWWRLHNCLIFTMAKQYVIELFPWGPHNTNSARIVAAKYMFSYISICFNLFSQMA